MLCRVSLTCSTCALPTRPRIASAAAKVASRSVRVSVSVRVRARVRVRAMVTVSVRVSVRVRESFRIGRAALGLVCAIRVKGSDHLSRQTCHCLSFGTQIGA